jgi:hypothetical protein
MFAEVLEDHRSKREYAQADEIGAGDRCRAITARVDEPRQPAGGVIRWPPIHDHSLVEHQVPIAH